MTLASSRQTHQSPAPWEWLIAPATALRLRPARTPRYLLVTEGRVWLTRSGSGPMGTDVWLDPGERVPLPAGTDWVAEGWPCARVQLLEAPAHSEGESFSGVSERRVKASLV